MTEPDNSRLSADDQRIIAEAREVAALGADDIRTYIHETDTLNRAQHLLAELARVATRLGERTAPPAHGRSAATTSAPGTSAAGNTGTGCREATVTRYAPRLNGSAGRPGSRPTRNSGPGGRADPDRLRPPARP